MAAIYSPNNTLLLRKKAINKTKYGRNRRDLKILISRNIFLSPETIMCVCAGGVWGVDLNPCFIF